MGALGDSIRETFDSLHDGTLMSGIDFAETISITNNVIGSYSTTTGAVAKAATTVSLKAIVTSYTVEEITASGGLIERGDLRMVVRASGAGTIDQHSTISYQSRTWRAIQVTPRVIDGAVYDYEIQARA